MGRQPRRLTSRATGKADCARAELRELPSPCPGVGRDDARDRTARAWQRGRCTCLTSILSLCGQPRARVVPRTCARRRSPGRGSQSAATLASNVTAWSDDAVGRTWNNIGWARTGTARTHGQAKQKPLLAGCRPGHAAMAGAGRTRANAGPTDLGGCAGARRKRGRCTGSRGRRRLQVGGAWARRPIGGRLDAVRPGEPRAEAGGGGAGERRRPVTRMVDGIHSSGAGPAWAIGWLGRPG
jgi:hypothetical protein